jgi:hypothetical protein
MVKPCQRQQKKVEECIDSADDTFTGECAAEFIWDSMQGHSIREGGRKEDWLCH